MSLCYEPLETPIGQILVAGTDSAICRISFETAMSQGWLLWFDRHFGCLPARGSAPVVRRALRQLDEYFRGERKTFDVPFQLIGTPFQRAVWKQLLRIPYGATLSYGEVARRVGTPRGAQAVGGAVGRNPIPIIVPCHRVVGYNGALVGFGGGLPAKEFLLELEGVRFPFRRKAGGNRPGRDRNTAAKHQKR